MRSSLRMVASVGGFISRAAGLITQGRALLSQITLMPMTLSAP